LQDDVLSAVVGISRHSGAIGRILNRVFFSDDAGQISGLVLRDTLTNETMNVFNAFYNDRNTSRNMAPKLIAMAIAKTDEDLNRLTGSSVNVITLASKVPQRLHEAICMLYSNAGSSRDLLRYLCAMINLQRRTPTNHWESCEQLNEKIVSDPNNYRYNFRNWQQLHSIFCHTIPIIPKTMSGVVFPTGKLSYGRAELDECVDPNCPDDLHKFLQEVYQAAYETEPNVTNASIKINGHDVVVYLRTMVPDNVRAFSVDADIMAAEIVRNSQLLNFVDTNTDNAQFAELTVDGFVPIIYQDASRNWFRLNSSTNGYEAYPMGPANCMALGLMDLNDQDACRNFIVQYLDSSPDIIMNMLTGMASNDNSIFERATTTLNKMHPQLAIQILNGLRFKIKNRDNPSGMQRLYSFEGVGEWQQRIVNTFPTISQVIQNYPGVLRYLSGIVSLANSNSSFLSPGANNPSGPTEIPQEYKNLGLELFTGDNNPYKMSQYGLQALSSTLASLTGKAMPLTAGLNLIPADRLASSMARSIASLRGSQQGGGGQLGGLAKKIDLLQKDQVMTLATNLNELLNLNPKGTFVKNGKDYGMELKEKIEKALKEIESTKDDIANIALYKSYMRATGNGEKREMVDMNSLTNIGQRMGALSSAYDKQLRRNYDVSVGLVQAFQGIPNLTLAQLASGQAGGARKAPSSSSSHRPGRERKW
jgi:hypothetical protein